MTEQELNAYIGYRLKQEEDTLIRHLAVQLLGQDRIPGKIQNFVNLHRPDLKIGFS